MYCVPWSSVSDVNKNSHLHIFINLICDERQARGTSCTECSVSRDYPPHLISVSLYDDGLGHGASGAAADQGGLLGDPVGLRGPVLSVVVVMKAAERNLLPILESCEILNEIIDHSDVFTIEVGLEEFSLLVLKV